MFFFIIFCYLTGSNFACEPPPYKEPTPSVRFSIPAPIKRLIELRPYHNIYDMMNPFCSLPNTVCFFDFDNTMVNVNNMGAMQVRDPNLLNLFKRWNSPHKAYFLSTGTGFVEKSLQLGIKSSNLSYIINNEIIYYVGLGFWVGQNGIHVTGHSKRKHLKNILNILDPKGHVQNIVFIDDQKANCEGMLSGNDLNVFSFYFPVGNQPKVEYPYPLW